MKNALNNHVGMLGNMFLWLVANLKQGVIYFIKQALPPNISAGSVGGLTLLTEQSRALQPKHIKFLRYRIFSSCVMHKKNYVHLILQIRSKANDVIKIA